MSHKRRPNTLFNMLFILVSVGMVSALGLSYTDHATKSAREEREKAKKIEAIQKVFPKLNGIQADNAVYFFPKEGGVMEPLTIDQKDKIDEKEKFKVIEVFGVKKDGQPAGFAVKTFTERGYSGKITMMIGFDAEGKITESALLEHKETPGLGTELDKSTFKTPLIGKTPDGTFKLKVKKDGGSVDAITGATISSRAFCDAVGTAYKAVCKQTSDALIACKNLNN